MESVARPPFARPSANDPYLNTLGDRVLIYDGATGTNFQLQDLHADDFGGAALEGCNEILVVTKPEAVESLHRSFLDVGADVIETDSFGAFSVVLAEYGIAERSFELAELSARIARRVADSYASPGAPRFVAGSMGPGTKFPSLGQITYDDLSASYEELALGLLEGGVDLLLVETVYDLLSGKAAIAAAHRAMVRHGRVVPIQAQVTIELTGRMLPGTEIGAALTALSPLGVDVLGLNCATGPVEMYEPLRSLCESAPMPLSCLPNAGLPSVVDGRMHYDLTPDALAEHLSKFVTEYGVQVVGGCCGTTPEHIERVVEVVRPLTPAKRSATLEPAVALDLLGHELPTGPFGVTGRRTYQRERVEEVPRRHARRRLGHLRRHRPRPDQRRRAHPRRLRRLHRRRRRGRHERTHESIGHAVVGADHGRHDRDQGRASGAHLARRQGPPQLGEPRRGRRSGDASRRLPLARRRVRRRHRRDLHRRRGTGAHGRVEGPRRARHHRPGRLALRPRPPGHLHRHLGPAAVDRDGRVAPRRHRDHRGDPTHQDRAPGRAHHPRTLQHLLRPQPGRAPGVEQRLLARVRRGRAGRRHRPRLEASAAQSHRRRGPSRLPRSHLRPTQRRLRPA